jgi:hypothetical protein
MLARSLFIEREGHFHKAILGVWLCWQVTPPGITATWTTLFKIADIRLKIADWAADLEKKAATALTHFVFGPNMGTAFFTVKSNVLHRPLLKTVCMFSTIP